MIVFLSAASPECSGKTRLPSYYTKIIDAGKKGASDSEAREVISSFEKSYRQFVSASDKEGEKLEALKTHVRKRLTRGKFAKLRRLYQNLKFFLAKKIHHLNMLRLKFRKEKFFRNLRHFVFLFIPTGKREDVKVFTLIPTELEATYLRELNRFRLLPKGMINLLTLAGEDFQLPFRANLDDVIEISAKVFKCTKLLVDVHYHLVDLRAFDEKGIYDYRLCEHYGNRKIENLRKLYGRVNTCTDELHNSIEKQSEEAVAITRGKLLRTEKVSCNKEGTATGED